MNQTTASAILVYGESDCRKTTNVVEFARYVKEKTGRGIRLLSAETAGVDRVQPGIDAGIITSYWLKIEPRSALQHFARGDWPQAVTQNGVVVARWLPSTTKMWDEIGGVACEGTASIAEAIIRHLVDTGRKIQEDVVGQYEEDGIKLGAAGRSHYGVAQQDILKLLADTPKGVYADSGGKCQYAMFTGHEAKGDDNKTNSVVYGVGTVGKAAVKSIPKLVGTLLHFEMDRKSGKVYAYLRPHPDSENPSILWDAKANLPAHPMIWGIVDCKVKGGLWKGPDGVQLQFEPGGRFELTFEQTLYHYMKFQEWAKVAVGQAMKGVVEKMEGVKV